MLELKKFAMVALAIKPGTNTVRFHPATIEAVDLAAARGVAWNVGRRVFPDHLGWSGRREIVWDVGRALTPEEIVALRPELPEEGTEF